MKLIYLLFSFTFIMSWGWFCSWGKTESDYHRMVAKYFFLAAKKILLLIPKELHKWWSLIYVFSHNFWNVYTNFFVQWDIEIVFSKLLQLSHKFCAFTSKKQLEDLLNTFGSGCPLSVVASWGTTCNIYDSLSLIPSSPGHILNGVTSERSCETKTFDVDLKYFLFISWSSGRSHA